MANFDPIRDLTGKFAPAVVVGVLSAGANVVEKQAKKTGNKNQFFQNASLWGDVALGAYSVFNYASDRGFYPTDSEQKLAMAGAGVALLSRRASDWVGAQFLGLETGARHTAIPGRSVRRGGRMALRSPGAAVETAVLPRKRQFFSVT